MAKKIECVFPTKKDVRWILSNVFGRRPGGRYKDWWREYVMTGAVGPEGVAELIISGWEAGRAKADKIGR